jgi:hypothetical protein
MPQCHALQDLVCTIAGHGVPGAEDAPLLAEDREGDGEADGEEGDEECQPRDKRGAQHGHALNEAPVAFGPNGLGGEDYVQSRLRYFSNIWWYS